MSLLRSRILWKIYAVFVAVIVIAAVIVSFVVSSVIEERTLADVRHSLDVRTQMLSPISLPVLQRGRVVDGDDLVKTLGHQTKTRFTVIKADGQVLADSDEDPQRMNNHQLRPEIRDSLYHSFGVSTRYSDTLKTRMMYLARAVQINGNLLGYVRASQPLNLINQRISHSRKMIILGISFITLLTLILGFFLARHFINPLLKLTRMAEAMADGDFSLSLKSKRRDEIGRLVQAFNLMAAKSRERIETINSDRSKLNAILTGMREGVVAVDRDDVVIHINQAAAAMFLVDADASIGKQIWEITRMQELCSILNDASQQGCEIKRNMNISYGISAQMVEMHAVPLTQGENRAGSGAMVVLFDVSEVRRLETIRRDFVSNASHELKTPITAIRALVETLIDDSKQMSETMRLSFLNKIAKQALRLSAIVVDLMDLSRFESQPEPLVLNTVVDLRTVVSDSVKSLTALADEKGITLELSEPDTELEILSDAGFIDQAITNILDNAIKYTSSCGQVTVTLQLIATEIVIAVQDTGIGIEPQDRERIFERFYRVDKARSRELGGTGLGLAIVRHIVLAHKGRIEVESQSGRGTTFRVILPLYKQLTQNS
ncbi:MAG: HAMP domain-containing protein [Deltaproteobacteria bacterium]|nr:HAMP domain-containing protein [Candidatus Tharpella sp.]